MRINEITNEGFIDAAKGVAKYYVKDWFNLTDLDITELFAKSTPAEITELQKKLKAAGASVPTSGTLDPATKNAVKQFPQVIAPPSALKPGVNYDIPTVVRQQKAAASAPTAAVPPSQQVAQQQAAAAPAAITPINEPVKLGGKTLDPNNPNDAKVLAALRTQLAKPTAPTMPPSQQVAQRQQSTASTPAPTAAPSMAELLKQRQRQGMTEQVSGGMLYLYEGGNVFDNTGDVAKQDVAQIVDTIKRELPSALQRQVMADIGSAGFKVASGDIDLFIDEQALLKNFGVDDVKTAKQALGQYFSAKGYAVKLSGRNVHVDVPYQSNGKTLYAQVDLMVIANAKNVADWHQHGPRGSYEDPGFKAGHLYILLNSIGKFLGVKVDAFGGTVMRRDDNTVVANTREQAAKILLNPSAHANDLNSVATVLTALSNDPDREGKLAQAKQDAAKGVLTLPEQTAPGTAAWFRKLGHNV